MAIVIDQLTEIFQGYEMSHLGAERVSFVSEKFLAENKQRPRRKEMALKGKKRPAETKYYFENARALAFAAKAYSEKIHDQVVAVLFRDADGTASAGRGNWHDKRNSMIEGFKAESFELGVAMVPNPKSEAWLLCATKSDAYQNCENLEYESGNDKASYSLKSQLSDSLGGNSSAERLNQLIEERRIDCLKINMPSFAAFRSDLNLVVRLANGARTQT